MMPIEASVSDGTIWSITLELTITILEALFTLIYYVYSTDITNDNHQLMIVICLKSWPSFCDTNPWRSNDLLFVSRSVYTTLYL